MPNGAQPACLSPEPVWEGGPRSRGKCPQTWRNFHPIHLLKSGVSLGFLSNAQSTLQSLSTHASHIPCSPLEEFLQSHFLHLKEDSHFCLSPLVFRATHSFYLARPSLPDPFTLIIAQAVTPVFSWPLGSRLWSTHGDQPHPIPSPAPGDIVWGWCPGFHPFSEGGQNIYNQA